MIAGLKGTVKDRQPDRVVVDVGGVYYECLVSLTTLGDVAPVGEPTELLVHTHVREDVLQLFGFSTPREKQLFLALVRVNGIGPKLASTILSGLPVDDLSRAVINGDLVRITSIPGVGKKMGERIILELGEKLAKELDVSPEAPSAQSGLAVEGELVSALINLGYREKKVRKLVEKLTDKHAPDTPLEELIRLALREMQP